MGTSQESRLSREPCVDRLKDRAVLITGAGGGQGEVVAVLFAEAGARVFVSGINGARQEETASLARTRGLSIKVMTVDASSEEQVSAWVADVVKESGRIDVLYNNGASGHVAPFSEMTAEQWRETLRLELDVVFVPTKAVWPHMMAQQSGSISNIASAAGMLGAEGTEAAAHSTSKGGLIALTRQLATEAAPHWIRVNAISPGPTMTRNAKFAYDALPAIRALCSAPPFRSGDLAIRSTSRTRGCFLLPMNPCSSRGSTCPSTAEARARSAL